ncbi:hypothetical protein SERLADRAFT_479536 [Serpula lacrymans var. lacrymans S7.9]|uniref:Uncharacterized protein n=1 Tax=Serpula lacrymans var. lacrymans (strain S7.9) TaxID=578457 RepID=F8PBY7_SERL9|nr:uncharacterized protein SERLADRAFT_479536 [Serpula lacrymans var. lacrymans S7.9]EGO19190.1 hypothetical protein SERLADRAFT_479536 [Serpula lacrymans var. lacrymans S7.9]
MTSTDNTSVVVLSSPPQAIKRATSISTSGRVVFLAHGNVSGSCSILFTNAVTSRSAY